MSLQLMKGNEAIAEAAIRAGCRFFSGYPITPQTEILEYFSWRMEEVGGTFVQTESEISGICMLYGGVATGVRGMTSSSGPGFTLKQEGISYIASGEVPAVIVDVMRHGFGLGMIGQGQGDYFQAVKGGGHGDYKCIVLAPSNVQESADLTVEAFDLAEKYRGPVILLSDAAIGQMMEAVELPPMQEHDSDKHEWAMRGCKRGEKHKIFLSQCYLQENYEKKLKEKYETIKSDEQRWEDYNTEGAEIILVAYGISSRIAKEAVKLAKKDGIKLGLIRPITLWPFPTKAFEKLSNNLKAIITIEMNTNGQLIEDVALASKCKYPLYTQLTNGVLPDSEDTLKLIKDIQNGKAQEVL